MIGQNYDLSDFEKRGELGCDNLIIMSSLSNKDTSGTDGCPDSKRQKIESDLKSFEIALELIKAGDSDKLKEMFVKREISDVDMIPKTGYLNQPRTLLRTASEFGQLECSKILLEHGATVDLLSKKGFGMDESNNSAIFSACSKGHIDVVKLLIEHGADVNNPACPPLCAACLAGDIELAKFLIERGAEVKAFPSTNIYIIRNPLAAAAHSGNAELVEYLIEKGADMHCERHKQNPFEEACACSHYNVLKVLLDHGAQIVKCQGHQACRRADVEMLKFLLDQGVDIEACNADGLTLFAVAYPTGHRPLITFLLEHGADPDAWMYDFSWAALTAETSSPTLTPLMYAVEDNDEGMMKLLLRYGASPNCAWIYGDDEDRFNAASPLIIACEPGHVKALKLLLEHGADVNRFLKAKSGQYETPLMYLFRTSWQPESEEKEEEQSHIEEEQSHTEEEQSHTEEEEEEDGEFEEERKGEDRSQEEEEEEESDEEACYMDEDWYERDKLGCLRLLLEHGADLTATNEKGETVFDYVKDRPDILEILNQYTDLKPTLK